MKKIILSKRFLHSVLLTLAFCMLPVLPALAQGDIVDRLDKALGITLPSEYKSKLKTFVQSSRVFKDKDASELTEQFIKDEMKKDWGISKQSQLLFIWTAINEKINGEYLYDGSDGNEKRLEEVDKVMETFEDCGKRYETAFRAHTKQRSAEADRRSAEADRDKITKSLEDIYQSLEKLSLSIDEYKKIIDEDGLGQDAKTLLKRFQQEKEKAANRANEISTRLKNYEQLSDSERDNIFASVKKLQSDVFDQRSSVAKQRSAEYDRRSAEYDRRSAEYDRRSAEYDRRSAEAIKQTISLTKEGLIELERFYNLYKKDPESVKREFIEQSKKNAKNIISNCKEYNIDYKSKLSPEVRKFYGVE